MRLHLTHDRNAGEVSARDVTVMLGSYGTLDIGDGGFIMWNIARMAAEEASRSSPPQPQKLA